MTPPIYFNSKTPGYVYLSNFFVAPFNWGGHTYQTVEHAYQASKFLEEPIRELIRKQPNAYGAFRMGRHGKPLRADWDQIKEATMRSLLIAKFKTHQPLMDKLIATAPAALVHLSPWGDRYWGKTLDGVGENRLGILLAELREMWISADALKKEYGKEY